jgi:hypothetical protein
MFHTQALTASNNMSYPCVSIVCLQTDRQTDTHTHTVWLWSSYNDFTVPCNMIIVMTCLCTFQLASAGAVCSSLPSHMTNNILSEVITGDETWCFQYDPKSIWQSLKWKKLAHKALSVKQFLAQKSITEMEHPLCSPDLSPNDFWLIPKTKCALKGWRFQDIEDIKRRADDCNENYSTTALKGWRFQDIEDIKRRADDCNENYSTTGVTKMFPKVAA